MTDWAKLLTTGDAKEQASAEAVDWAREITKPASIGPAQSKMPTGYAEPREVSFGTHFQAGIVDKPQSKIEIYAKELGIPKERFGVDKQGEIFYIDVDGLPKKISDDSIGGKTKEALANTAANAPEIILSTAGSVVGGPWGAAAGGAVGDVLRKMTGRLAFDEPSTMMDFGKSAAKAGALSAAGDWLGGKAIGLADRAMGAEGSRLVRASGRDIDTMNPADMAAREAEGRTFGMSLTPIEITGSKRLSRRLEMLGQQDATSDVVQALRQTRNKENVDAINKYLDRFAPATTSPGDAGRLTIDASNDAIKAENLVRQNRARPYYESADPTVIEQDQVKAFMQNPVISKAVNYVRSNPIYQQGLKGFDKNSLKVFDLAKRRMGDMEEAAARAGNKYEASIIKDARKELVDTLDIINPDYKMARSIFSEESALPEMIGGTKIAKFAQMGPLTDEAEKVAGMVFKSTPESLAITKNYIVKYGGQDAWDSLMRVHLSDLFDKAMARNPDNVGFWFAKAIKNPQEQKLLQVATEHNPMIMENLNRFAEILDRSRLVLGTKESITATRSAEMAAAKREGAAEPLLRYAEDFDATKPATWVGLGTGKINAIRDALYAKRNMKIAEAMESPVAAQQMMQMLRLDPKSRKFIEGLSTFTTMLVGGEFAPVFGRTGWYGERSRSERIKPTQEGRLTIPQ